MNDDWVREAFDDVIGRLDRLETMLELDELIRGDGTLQREILRAERETARADRMEAKLEEITRYFNARVIPALERSTTATTMALERMFEIYQEMKDLRGETSDIEEPPL